MISFFTKNFPNVVALGWGGDAGWGTAKSEAKRS